MTWINTSTIPNDEEFLDIVTGLVFNCPSCEEKRKKDCKNVAGEDKYKREYVPVSIRNSTFRKRGVCGSLLKTLLLQISKPLEMNGTYALLKNGEQVDAKVSTILSSSSLSDPYFDMIVFQKKSEMSDVEALYYYIRNAFAHGAFEVINVGGERVYKLESAKNNSVKAQMRLKESTLNRLIELSLLKGAEVRDMQKPRAKKQSSHSRKIL